MIGKWREHNTENLNTHGFELHRPSIKGNELLFWVIKAIIVMMASSGSSGIVELCAFFVGIKLLWSHKFLHQSNSHLNNKLLSDGTSENLVVCRMNWDFEALMRQYYLQVANKQFEISTVEDNEQCWNQILRIVSPILNVWLIGHAIY